MENQDQSGLNTCVEPLKPRGYEDAKGRTRGTDAVFSRKAKPGIQRVKNHLGYRTFNAIASVHRRMIFSFRGLALIRGVLIIG